MRRANAPHPVLRTTLSPHAGRGGNTPFLRTPGEGARLFCARRATGNSLLPVDGEKVPEGRMRGAFGFLFLPAPR